jgi:mRNA interferase RelE/StbE
MHKIEFSHLAAKELGKVYNIDKKLYSRFIVVIETLKTNPYQGKRLKGKLTGDYSLRLGNYRIIYMVKEDRLIIYIIDLGHRSKIYK